MKFRWIILAVFIALVGCATRRTIPVGSVSHEPSGIPSSHGLWYYLPRTVIRVEIVAEKVVARHGPFFRHSERLLNIADVKTESLEEWRIVGAHITTIGQPDKNRLFRISTSETTSIAAINLTADGILAGINIDNIVEPTPYVPVIEDVITLKDVNFNAVPFTGEQLVRSSTTAMAEEVAKEIFRLRQLRSQILKGEVEMLPPDKGSYQLALSEIERQEMAFTELFTGKQATRTIKRYFDFIPQDGQSLNTTLFRFSPVLGFLDPLDLRGTPVFIEVTADTNNFRNFVTAETRNSLNSTGLVYCKPATAQVKVIDRTLLLTSREVLLSQFGQVVRMPADLLINPGVGVELDTATGAIKRVFYK